MTNNTTRRPPSPRRQFVTKVFSWFLLAAVIAGALALIVVPKATGVHAADRPQRLDGAHVRRR